MFVRSSKAWREQGDQSATQENTRIPKGGYAVQCPEQEASPVQHTDKVPKIGRHDGGP